MYCSFLQQFSTSYPPTLQYTQCPTGCPTGYQQTSLTPPPPGTCCPTPVCEPIICTVGGVGYLEGESVPSHICETWYDCFTVGSCSEKLGILQYIATEILFLFLLASVSLVELWSAVPSILAVMEAHVMQLPTAVSALEASCTRPVAQCSPPAKIHFPRKGTLKAVSVHQDCT